MQWTTVQPSKDMKSRFMLPRGGTLMKTWVLSESSQTQKATYSSYDPISR